MSTGIPFLDNLIRTVNNISSGVMTAINNAVNYSSNVTQQNQQIIGGYLNNGVSTANAVYNAVVQPYVSQNSLSIPVPAYFPNIQPGYAPGPSAYSPYYPVPNQQSMYFSSQQLGQFQDLLNYAVSQLQTTFPQIFGQYTQPFTSTVQNLYNNFQAYTSNQINAVQGFLSNFAQSVYASTSNVLNSVGIQVGQWGNLLDSVIRQVMLAVGYSATQASSAVTQAVYAGQAAQQQAIQLTTTTLQRFADTISGYAAQEKENIQQLVQASTKPSLPEPGDIISQAVNAAGEELQKVLSDTVKDISENPNNFIHQLSDRVDTISSVIDDLKAGKFHNSQEFFNALFGNEPATGLARTLIILASVIPTLISAVNLAGNPALEAFQLLINADSPVKLLGLGEYVNAYFKGQVDYGTLKNRAAKLGVSENELKILLYQSYVEPGVNTMVNARRRGFVDDTTWDSYLNDLRFSAENKDLFNKMLVELPPPQDLTRIADKRVWSGNIDAKYGQFSELPQEYIDYMGQWGYKGDFVKWIWASHWQLPSPQQVFEMFHRNVIDTEDMNAFLALTDWLPFFRDKLLQISYNPITRVDIRRIYGLGLIGYDELITRYRAIGYSPQDAKVLADFTVKYESQGGESKIDKLKDKIITAVEGLYVRGKLTRQEALDRLVSLGEDRQLAEVSLNYLVLEQSLQATKPKLETYKTKAVNLVVKSYLSGHYSPNEAQASLVQIGLSDIEASEELKYADIERQVSVRDSQIQIFEQRYIEGVDDLATFTSSLAQLGLSAAEIGQETIEADLKIEKRFKMPTEKQVIDWFNKGVIDENWVISYLKFQGYPDVVLPAILAGDFGIGQ